MPEHFGMDDGEPIAASHGSLSPAPSNVAFHHDQADDPKSAAGSSGAAHSSVPSASFSYALACELSAVREAAAAACRFLVSQGVCEEDVMACELALVEAANNAILYAQQSSRQKPVR